MIYYKQPLASSKKIEYNKNVINKIIDQAVDEFCRNNKISRNEFISKTNQNPHPNLFNLSNFINNTYNETEVSLSEISNYIKSADLF